MPKSRHNVGTGANPNATGRFDNRHQTIEWLILADLCLATLLETNSELKLFDHCCKRIGELDIEGT